MDVSMLRIIIPRTSTPFEQRVAEILREEISLRAGVAPDTAQEVPEGGSFILIRLDARLSAEHPALYARLDGQPRQGPEGFRLSVTRAQDVLQIIVAGTDDRGCLYGMAKILRKAAIKAGQLVPTEALQDCCEAPRHPLRGHQLAYRDKQNTLPTWTIDRFDRYIRDRALFGANAIEIVPPRTDDNLYSAHFKQGPMEMMVSLSRLIHSYGLAVWIWYPFMCKDYADPARYAQDMREREQVLSALPHVDGVLFPAGDPGNIEVDQLFPAAADTAAILHRYHPQARIWLSPQVYFHEDTGWYDAFYARVRQEPDWLYGICYGPWIQQTIDEMAAMLPEVYRGRIRHYPDITHNANAQYELPDWDPAFALTLGRESYNVRPRAMRHIHSMTAPYTIGSLTYSEGIHDDVNQMLWSDLDFNPDRPLEDSLRDYARLFIDPDLADDLCDVLMLLERNWEGKACENEGIDALYHRFMALSDRASASVHENFRFQMIELRVLSDYEARHRRIHDLALERAAEEALRAAPASGSVEAIREARRTLRLSFDEPPVPEVRRRMQRLADSLRASCGIRLTTWRHGAQSTIRGAYLDTLDTPLNDYAWYMQHLSRIAALDSEPARLSAIAQLVGRTDPGEGGFYDWLGDVDSFHRRVVLDKTWAEDPGFLHTPMLWNDPYGLQVRMRRDRGWAGEVPITLRWVFRARVIYDTPLKVRYDGLDPAARYRLRVSYPDLLSPIHPKCYKAHLHAGAVLIHDQVDFDGDNPVREYALPPDAYRDGSLLLTWRMVGTLFPLSVAEIWIVKEA